VFHHITVEVSDTQRAGIFYDALLSPLGWRRQVDTDSEMAWGLVKPVFYIKRRAMPNTGGALVTFAANGIAAVKGAFEGGVASGGMPEDKPSQRPESGPAYYSAFVNDPDGNRLEVAVLPD
jgi:catechol 2,3-dioxygenase-like lactoylglutathione lyase family enzyme